MPWRAKRLPARRAGRRHTPQRLAAGQKARKTVRDALRAETSGRGAPPAAHIAHAAWKSALDSTAPRWRPTAICDVGRSAAGGMEPRPCYSAQSLPKSNHDLVQRQAQRVALRILCRQLWQRSELSADTLRITDTDQLFDLRAILAQAPCAAVTPRQRAMLLPPSGRRACTARAAGWRVLCGHCGRHAVGAGSER